MVNLAKIEFIGSKNLIKEILEYVLSGFFVAGFVVRYITPLNLSLVVLLAFIILNIFKFHIGI